MDTPIYVTKNEEAIRKSFEDFKSETIMGSIKKEEELGEKSNFSAMDIASACIFKLCEILELRFEHLLDLLANPISAMMQNRVFPVGHAKELEFWLKYCGVLDCIITDPEINGRFVNIPETVRETLAKPCDKLQEILGYLNSADIGADHGYTCIHDYWNAVNAHREDFINALKEVRTALPLASKTEGGEQ